MIINKLSIKTEIETDNTKNQISENILCIYLSSLIGVIYGKSRYIIKHRQICD